MAAPSDTITTLDADTLNGDAASGWRNLVRNAYLTAWVSDRPCYFGLPSSGTTPATAPAKDTTTGQGYRGGAAMLWTAGGADAANAMLQDIGGAIGLTLGGASVYGSWQGITTMARVKTAVASLVRARITHNAVDYVSDWHTGGGAWEDLAVTLPKSVAYTSGQSVEVGIETAATTAGAIYVDHIQASMGEWLPGPLITRPSVLRAEMGALQSSWSRRSEGGTQMVHIKDIDGEVRTGGIYLDFSPSWDAICGVTLPNVVGLWHAPNITGTNAWTASQLRATGGMAYDAATGVITIAPLSAVTFAVATTEIRSGFLVAIEPLEGGAPYPKD